MIRLVGERCFNASLSLAGFLGNPFAHKERDDLAALTRFAHLPNLPFSN